LLVADTAIRSISRLVSLGEICDIVKGNTPTLKAIPGDYPLVVTGASPRTSHEYQLDCEAVCIPIVSSTGHGHASINRIHYQSGKFALANIMVALVPKLDSGVLTKYLHLLLMARKDELLVPLMAGTSNVSLRLPDLAQIKVSIPPVNAQLESIEFVERCLTQLEAARSQRRSISLDFERLLIALAHRDDLTDHEKLALGWHRVKLGDVIHLDLEPVKVNPSAEYPNLGVYSFGKGAFGKPPLDGMTLSAKVLFRVRVGQFVYLKLNGYEGAYADVPSDLDGYYVTNEFPTFSCNADRCRSEWLACLFKKPTVWQDMARHSKGTPTRRQRVNPDAILAQEVWLPTLNDQDRIADVLRAQRRYKAIDTFESEVEVLRRSILSKAVEGAF
jgi:hypothetical protein